MGKHRAVRGVIVAPEDWARLVQLAICIAGVALALEFCGNELMKHFGLFGAVAGFVLANPLLSVAIVLVAWYIGHRVHDSHLYDRLTHR
jgi:hypothetical protein